MGITSQEITELLFLALIAGSIGGTVGLVNLRTGTFSWPAVLCAVLISNFLICAAYFAGTFFSPIPPQNVNLNHFTYAFIDTLFIGPGLCLYGTIPAILGNVESQLVCRKLKQRFR